MKPSTAQLTFWNLANYNPDVLSDSCKFTLEPVDVTLYGKSAIADFWDTSESFSDVHPTIYTSGSTIIVETLRMVTLDSDEMHYTPSWEGLRGATLAVDMTIIISTVDSLITSVRHKWNHVDVLQQCHIFDGRVSLDVDSEEFLNPDPPKEKYSGGRVVSVPVNGITCVSTTALQTSFLTLNV
ncbi:hypothetical protein CJU89_5519 [Yarrowia sp. B02]|nr:hypothetical protein CJU89_5519 [Yarrowia sp. B02]